MDGSRLRSMSICFFHYMTQTLFQKNGLLNMHIVYYIHTYMHGRRL